MDIFEERKNIKPVEYPELLKYKDAIRQSFWVHTEYQTEVQMDIQDYKVKCTKAEQEAIKRTMLSIAQIELPVKEFWGTVYKWFPKPEIAGVGYTFAESEVRHSDAYSFLLELLGLDEIFLTIDQIPPLKNRMDYLKKYIQIKADDKKDRIKKLLVFSMFIEHVSLFSQFLIMMSFRKYKNILKGIANIVSATSKEEQLHSNFGSALVNIIKNENPDSFTDPEFQEYVKEACQDAYETERVLLTWIFEEGELDFLPIDSIDNYIKYRFNSGLKEIGFDEIFDVDENKIAELDWFEDKVLGVTRQDFFEARPTTYTRAQQSFTSQDLF
jgi:ribonucleoside-diphosphate reductase beta chain